MIKIRKYRFNTTTSLRLSKLYKKLKYLTEDKIVRDVPHVGFFEMFVDPALLEIATDHLRGKYKRLGEKDGKIS